MDTPSPPRDGDAPNPTRAESPTRVDLEYFAANAPDHRQSRTTWFCGVALVLGCVPYLCGVINALVVEQSYSPEVTAAHVGGATVFMGLGILLSAAALAGFARAKHLAGVLAAVLLLGMQASVAACMGMARWAG